MAPTKKQNKESAGRGVTKSRKIKSAGQLPAHFSCPRNRVPSSARNNEHSQSSSPFPNLQLRRCQRQLDMVTEPDAFEGSYNLRPTPARLSITARPQPAEGLTRRANLTSRLLKRSAGVQRETSAASVPAKRATTRALMTKVALRKRAARKQDPAPMCFDVTASGSGLSQENRNNNVRSPGQDTVGDSVTNAVSASSSVIFVAEKPTPRRDPKVVEVVSSSEELLRAASVNASRVGTSQVRRDARQKALSSSSVTFVAEKSAPKRDPKVVEVVSNSEEVLQAGSVNANLGVTSHVSHDPRKEALSDTPSVECIKILRKRASSTSRTTDTIFEENTSKKRCVVPRKEVEVVDIEDESSKEESIGDAKDVVDINGDKGAHSVSCGKINNAEDLCDLFANNANIAKSIKRKLIEQVAGQESKTSTEDNQPGTSQERAIDECPNSDVPMQEETANIATSSRPCFSPVFPCLSVNKDQENTFSGGFFFGAGARLSNGSLRPAPPFVPVATSTYRSEEGGEMTETPMLPSVKEN